MNAKKDTRLLKVQHLADLVSKLNEKQIDALITLLDHKSSYELRPENEEHLLVADQAVAYGARKSKSVSAEKASGSIRKQLRKLRK